MLSRIKHFLGQFCSNQMTLTMRANVFEIKFRQIKDSNTLMPENMVCFYLSKLRF